MGLRGEENRQSEEPDASEKMIFVLGTDNIREQIPAHIFAPKKVIVYLPRITNNQSGIYLSKDWRNILLNVNTLTYVAYANKVTWRITTATFHETFDQKWHHFLMPPRGCL